MAALDEEMAAQGSELNAKEEEHIEERQALADEIAALEGTHCFTKSKVHPFVSTSSPSLPPLSPPRCVEGWGVRHHGLRGRPTARPSCYVLASVRWLTLTSGPPALYRYIVAHWPRGCARPRGTWRPPAVAAPAPLCTARPPARSPKRSSSTSAAGASQRRVRSTPPLPSPSNQGCGGQADIGWVARRCCRWWPQHIRRQRMPRGPPPPISSPPPAPNDTD